MIAGGCERGNYEFYAEERFGDPLTGGLRSAVLAFTSCLPATNID